MKKQLVITIFIFCTAFLEAQNNQWVNYTSGTNVTAMDETDTHFWISTTGGLVKQDKATGENDFFHRGNSNIASNLLIDVIVDKDGLVWISSDAGLITFDGTNWTTFSDRLGQLTKNINGTVVFADATRLSFWDGNNFQDIDTPVDEVGLRVDDIIIDPNTGNSWISLSTYLNFAIYQYDGSDWIVYNDGNSNLPYESSTNNDLSLDNDGNLWCGTYHGVYRFDGTDWNGAHVLNPSFPSGLVQGICSSSDGKIWATSSSFGENPVTTLIEITDVNNFVQHDIPINKQNNFVFNFNHNFNPDQAIYIGTQYFGLLKFENNDWTTIETNGTLLLNNYVRQIFRDNYSMWVTTGATYQEENNVLFNINKENWTSYNNQNLPFAISPRNIELLTRRGGGDIWAWADDTLRLFTIGEWTNPATPDLLPDVDETNSYIHFSLKGEIFLLELHHSNILFKGDGPWKVFPHEVHGAVSGIYRAYFNHPVTGDFWLASANGISRFDGESWEFIEPTQHGAYSDQILDMVYDKQGDIYATTYRDLLKIDASGIQIIDTEGIHPLDEKQFATMTIGPDGALWVGLRNELARFDDNGWYIFDNNNSGLPNGLINNLVFDAIGNLWIGSSTGGLSIYHPDGVTFSNPNPPICNLYPNPVTSGNYSQLSLDESFVVDPSATITCVSSNGDIIWSNKLDRSGFELNSMHTSLPTGLYFLSIKNKEEVFSCPLVVK